MHEAFWTVSAIVSIVGLLIWFLHNQSMQSLRTVKDVDSVHFQTVLQQDIPRHSFLVLYDARFPFDTTDREYQSIKTLEREYSDAMRCFMTDWIAFQTADSVVSALERHEAVVARMNRVETLLDAIYDLLAKYMSVECDDMDTFQDSKEEVHEWFDEIRRMHQAQMRQMI